MTSDNNENKTKMLTRESSLMKPERTNFEEHFMKKNGDPLWDLEANWYEELQPFWDQPDDLVEDAFMQWKAKHQYELDKKTEERASQQHSSGQSSTSKVAKTKTYSGPAKMVNKYELKKLEEYREDIIQLKRKIPELERKVTKLEKAARRGIMLKKSDEYSNFEKIMQPIKAVKTALRFSKN